MGVGAYLISGLEQANLDSCFVRCLRSFCMVKMICFYLQAIVQGKPVIDKIADSSYGANIVGYDIKVLILTPSRLVRSGLEGDRPSMYAM